MLAAVACILLFASGSPTDASPNDPRRVSSDCATCHEAEAATWKRSAHASAWSNGVFQAAYRVEPQAFCRGCHAPQTEGVSCVSCHAKPHSGEPASDCASCHEFAFPGRPPAGHVATLMQTTVREHDASPASSTACRDCHMRPERGVRDHASIVDRALVEEGLAVDVSAERTSSGVRARFALTSRAGHAVPTGDLMRRLELRAWLDGQPPVRRELSREFTGLSGARVEISDERVPASGATLLRDIELRGEAKKVHFAVDRLRMPEAQARAQSISEDVNRMPITNGIAIVR